EPEVSSSRSISATSRQPALARWNSTLQPTTPPPITATRTWDFMPFPRLIRNAPSPHRPQSARRPHRVEPAELDEAHHRGPQVVAVEERLERRDPRDRQRGDHRIDPGLVEERDRAPLPTGTAHAMLGRPDP